MPLRCDEMLKRGRRIGSMIAERCPWDVMRWWEWWNEKEKWDDENVPMRRRALEMKRGGEVHVSPIKIIGIIMVNCRNMSLIWDDENVPMRKRAVEIKRGRRIGSMIAERCPWWDEMMSMKEWERELRWWECSNEKESWDDENAPMRRRAVEMKRRRRSTCVTYQNNRNNNGKL